MMGDKRFKTANCKAIARYEEQQPARQVFLLRSAQGYYFRQMDDLDPRGGAAVDPLTFGNAVTLFEGGLVQRLVSFEEAFPDGVPEW